MLRMMQVKTLRLGRRERRGVWDLRGRRGGKRAELTDGGEGGACRDGRFRVLDALGVLCRFMSMMMVTIRSVL